MNSICCFARRIVSAVTLATVIPAGWSQAGAAQPEGIDPQAEKLRRHLLPRGFSGKQHCVYRVDALKRSVEGRVMRDECRVMRDFPSSVPRY